MAPHLTWRERALQNQKLHGERVEARQRERAEVTVTSTTETDRLYTELTGRSAVASKALAATRGTQFGAILACAFDTETEAPKFVGKAVVTSDGYVQCNFTGADGRNHHSAFVGSVLDLVNNAHQLARHLTLSPADKSELFATLKSWIAVNYSGRAVL